MILASKKLKKSTCTLNIYDLKQLIHFQVKLFSQLYKNNRFFDAQQRLAELCKSTRIKKEQFISVKKNLITKKSITVITILPSEINTISTLASPSSLYFNRRDYIYMHTKEKYALPVHFS